MVKGRRLLWVVFVATVLLQPAGALVYFVFVTQPAIVQGAYLVTKLVMLVSPMLLLRFGLPLPRLSMETKVMAWLIWGAWSGLVFSMVILGVSVLFGERLEAYAGSIAAKVGAFGIAGWYAVAAGVFSIVHSAFEEYFWRWYVVGGLANRYTWFTSAAIGNILFASHHFIVLSQFFPPLLTIAFGSAVGIAGFVWSYIYRKTGSLYASWLSHGIVDATVFWIGYRLIS